MIAILTAVTIVFAVAWVAAGLLRRSSAASRHVIWTRVRCGPVACAAAFASAPSRDSDACAGGDDPGNDYRNASP